MLVNFRAKCDIGCIQRMSVCVCVPLSNFYLFLFPLLFIIVTGLYSTNPMANGVGNERTQTDCVRERACVCVFVSPPI